MGSNLLAFMDWEGQASWASLPLHLPLPSSKDAAVEVFNVGSWLTDGDKALEAGVDFLSVVEHRLIPAWVRSTWARKGLASIWAPACQVSSHVGNAGVGVVSMRGAPVALPTFATAQFQRFLTAVGLLGACSLWVEAGS